MPSENGNITLADVAELIGWEAAATISARFGGTKLYIAAKPGEGSQLAFVVGEAAARKLGEAFGSEYLSVPLRIGKHARILALREKGRTIREIALELNCSTRTVERVCATRAAPDIEDTGRGKAKDPRQLDMFTVPPVSV